MQLRNKKTGEIGYLRSLNWFETALIIMDKNGVQLAKYESLAELNAEWKDYEEPEEDFWYVDTDCETYGVSRAFNQNNSDDVLFNKSIGNYFETREEAEKAVEKLKAWKRLKDNGFKFEGTNNRKRKTGYFINYYLGKSFNSQDECEQAMKDLDLLFGGEE